MFSVQTNFFVFLVMIYLKMCKKTIFQESTIRFRNFIIFVKRRKYTAIKKVLNFSYYFKHKQHRKELLQQRKYKGGTNWRFFFKKRTNYFVTAISKLPIQSSWFHIRKRSDGLPSHFVKKRRGNTFHQKGQRLHFRENRCG